MTEPTQYYLAGALIFLLAGAVKGTLGLGLPTIAIGILGLAMPPAEAAALLVMPSLVTNVWQLVRGPHLRVLARRFWPMLTALVAGTWLSAFWITSVSVDFTTGVLGAVIVVYALAGLTKLPLRVPASSERWAGPVAGAVTGIMGGISGNFVFPAIPYFSALELERDELVQALGLFLTVSTLALAAALLWHGILSPKVAGDSLLALIPALVGVAMGAWLRTRIRPATFRTIFFAGLLVLGAELVVRSLP